MGDDFDLFDEVPLLNRPCDKNEVRVNASEEQDSWPFVGDMLRVRPLEQPVADERSHAASSSGASDECMVFVFGNPQFDVSVSFHRLIPGLKGQSPWKIPDICGPSGSLVVAVGSGSAHGLAVNGLLGLLHSSVLHDLSEIDVRPTRTESAHRCVRAAVSARCGDVKSAAVGFVIEMDGYGAADRAVTLKQIQPDGGLVETDGRLKANPFVIAARVGLPPVIDVIPLRCSNALKGQFGRVGKRLYIQIDVQSCIGRFPGDADEERRIDGLSQIPRGQLRYDSRGHRCGRTARRSLPRRRRFFRSCCRFPGRRHVGSCRTIGLSGCLRQPTRHLSRNGGKHHYLGVVRIDLKLPDWRNGFLRHEREHGIEVGAEACERTALKPAPERPKSADAPGVKFIRPKRFVQIRPMNQRTPEAISLGRYAEYGLLRRRSQMAVRRKKVRRHVERRFARIDPKRIANQENDAGLRRRRAHLIEPLDRANSCGVFEFGRLAGTDLLIEPANEIRQGLLERPRSRCRRVVFRRDTRNVDICHRFQVESVVKVNTAPRRRLAEHEV